MSNIKTVQPFEKAYTVFVVILPILSVYASGVPGFTVGDAVLVVFFLCRILHGLLNKNIYLRKHSSPIFMIVVAMVLLTLFSMLMQTNYQSKDIVIRVIRRTFYYCSVIIISGEWFNFNLAKRYITVIGLIGAAYMFAQYISFYWGKVVLPGFIPSLPVYHENYAELNYQEIYSKLFRPTSFLLEPAHISRYLNIPLIILLFSEKQSKSEILCSFIITAAILGSTSGTGLISAGLIWALWIIVRIFTSTFVRKLPAYYLAVYLILLIAIIYALNTSIVQSNLYRIVNSKLTDVNTAGGARFRGYIQFFNLDGISKIIGMGYGSTPNTVLPTWFSGASYMLYGTGIVGFIICVIMFVQLFLRNTCPISRIICIIWFFLFFVDDSFMSNVSVVYFSFICTGCSKTKRSRGKNEYIIPDRLLVS